MDPDPQCPGMAPPEGDCRRILMSSMKKGKWMWVGRPRHDSRSLDSSIPMDAETPAIQPKVPQSTGVRDASALPLPARLVIMPPPRKSTTNISMPIRLPTKKALIMRAPSFGLPWFWLIAWIAGPGQI